MHANDGLQVTDTRRLSPQTTSSSGYQSDLSSSNQSPESIRKNPIEFVTNLPTDKKSNKNFSRISSFIRKQYERAKLKLIPTKQPSPPPPPVKTCSKSTSTTALSNPSEANSIKVEKSPSSRIKRSSFILSVQPIYVSPSNQDGFSRHSSHRLSSSSQPNKIQVTSHSYRRVVALSNCENTSSGFLTTHSCRYPTKARHSQDYYPYKYLQKNYSLNQSTYVPLSDFHSTRNSAFKPVRSSRRRTHDLSEQITTPDDPCDLEVAQYFHQTPQWSNPNYVDVCKREMALLSARQNYTETLC